MVACPSTWAVRYLTSTASHFRESSATSLSDKVRRVEEVRTGQGRGLYCFCVCCDGSLVKVLSSSDGGGCKHHVCVYCQWSLMSGHVVNCVLAILSLWSLHVHVHS